MKFRDRLLALTATLICATALQACSGDDAGRASTIKTSDLKGLGSVLVDAKNETLYIFKPDNAKSVTCTSSCAANWPPLDAADGKTPSAGKNVKQSLLGKTRNPSGGDVVTYNGWPLYRYTADRTPGEHRGQNLQLNGGLWFAMTPSGKPLDP